MEALGAASAILSIATVGAQCSVRLISFAAQVKTASERITRIAEDVSLNTSILQQVGELIKQSIDGGELPDRWENEGDQEQHSMVAGEGAKSTEAKQGVFNTSGLETTMKIATKCKDIFSGLNERLQNASRQLSNGSGKIVRVKLTRVERLKWPFLQPEIDTMRDELKDARGTLTLMFQVAMLAYLGKAMQRPNWQPQHNTMIIPYSQEDLTWLKTSIVAIRKTQTLETDPQKDSLPTRVAPSELDTCQLPDARATTAHCKRSEAMLETNVHKSTSNPKAGKRSIFDPIPDPGGKLLKHFSTYQRQNKCTQTETISEPAEPSSESLTMHIFTPQASIQDNDILINHRHHTINLSPKEVKSQLDAWKSSTPSSICEQLQALTFKERFALDMNKLIGHTTQYPFYKARLEWIHFGEYGPIIHGLETPKARALTVITSSEASPLPSPSRFFPDWNFDKQDRSLPCPPPGKRPTLKVAIDEMNDMPQAHTPESKAASSVVLPPPSPKIEREEEKEEEEDQDDRLSENDWEAEGIVQGLLAAYTT
ncbi:hypothetical protein ANOM_011567 [Aspergillus nomiae NRRL 13137]|uniref:Fungal N-terminal domain-containing protein n=2 Tax=Aspergillus subgen. Circumdati TaxID=2720871 RepID=A0A0L1INR9_ASPN3|nr:uncharacterized protein ANOM_011567 [Aspergillus nomiae NRRL 13137]KNG80955.1 hypothetical protein ANOM_011567 [Aspergillus nomiae NRRL 13137]